MPLYDILNEFQKGQSHMAAVVRRSANMKSAATSNHNNDSGLNEDKTNRSSFDQGGGGTNASDAKIDIDTGGSDMVNTVKDNTADQTVTKTTEKEASDDLEEREVIGIITLEDVIEELLQEEIVDETDEYVDVHKRIRVAAAAVAVSSVLLTRTSSAARLLSMTRNARHAQSQKSVKDVSDKPDKAMKRSSSLKQPLLDKR